MILKQFYLPCLAHASYMVIDQRTKSAAVIDPQRDIEQYVEEAERRGATIKYVLLTHFHADFIAGHLELRDKLGARIYLGARAETEYDFTPLKDGDVLEFGDVRLKILETPGHTPEGISIVVFDLAKSDQKPQAVFTGDTLFVGDVGRPDLLASIGVTADELGGMLYDSLRQKLMKLPGETIVYPAHGAGSMCGKNLGQETFSTIGEQRTYNYALQPMAKQAFIALVTADQPEAPQYFTHDAVLNRKERSTLAETLERGLKPLSLEEFSRLQKDGARALDVRPAADFAGSHVTGSINIGLDGKFATWSGTAIPPDARILIVADPGAEREAALRLGRIGLDNVVGFLSGGMGALEAHLDLVQSTERITAQALAALQEDGDAPFVVDVRSESEWNDCHIEGSTNIPLAQLEQRKDEIPRDRDVVVMCRTGYRSSLATSMLQRQAFGRLSDLVGGIEGWRASDLKTVVPA